MRDVKKIWDNWRSGIYVGDTKPSTRVTVESVDLKTPLVLHATGPVVGQWHRGPARWYQRKDPAQQIETEIPGVLSVSSNRSVEPEAGTCDITIRNTTTPVLGAPEVPPGQLGDLGHYTPERGESQEANARWGHAVNPWHGILVPNALIRTYQGFGGQDKSVRDAVADGNIILNGVWLVDDVTINTDGTLALRCRDMMKLLIDQQLVPPLVPTELYPLLYQRYRMDPFPIPADPPPGTDAACPPTFYPSGWGIFSSTDEVYGQYNTFATGHPPTDAFDISYEQGPIVPGSLMHQRTYWLSEPKGSPHDSVWIEMETPYAGLPINEVYIHSWRGSGEGKGFNLVMISVWEGGRWAPVEYEGGGITPQGIPYVATCVPGIESHYGENTNRFPLGRDYRATRIRLTWTNLIWADDYPADHGGFRAGARKLMSCFNPQLELYPAVVMAGDSIPVNEEGRTGYWQARTTGRVFAFGDARTYPQNNPGDHAQWKVCSLVAHPLGHGYWTLDASGFVAAYGMAQHFGDPSALGRLDYVDMASSPSGNGYWILASNGEIWAFGDAQYFGNTSHSGNILLGSPAWAVPRIVPAWPLSIESHPSEQGYWVLWADGFVQEFNLPNLGYPDQATWLGIGIVWAVTIQVTSTGKGYWILNGGGGVISYGDAVNYGNAPAGPATSEWYYGIFWGLLPSSIDDKGYLLQRADGILLGCGTTQQFGSIGDGHGELRYDGNYKDYSDVIRDLALWAGFYLHENPQPEGALPAVYGNVESTGIYSMNDPLPQEMFDKRPVLDAMRDIRAIVGYALFVDAEGGFRFEVPNIWGMGNYLSNVSGDERTAFSYMPEIDERVQLTSHSVVRSASSARSEIIVATEYPYTTVNGQPAPEGIVKTRIEGMTKPDLRGIINPAMWTNGQFLNQKEQQTMAELIDLRIWFQRRTANIQCVANPLIDVNDQVRVIERQTGDVYVHYIKSLSVSHDLQSGAFTMSLTTHWMGGTPYGQLRLYYACAARPQGDGYWQIAANSDINAFGEAKLHERNDADSHLSWPVAMRSTSSGNGYWTMDQNGKVLSYGDGTSWGSLSGGVTDAVDFAVTPSGEGYWILRSNGEVHTFGDAMYRGDADVPAGAKAQSIESHPSGAGYWTLLSTGVVQAFGVLHYGDAERTGFRPNEILTRLRATASGSGYWIVSQSGKVQNFNAPHNGDAVPYPDDKWNLGIVWDFIADPSGGYGLQHADGKFEMFGVADAGAVRATTFGLSWALVTTDAHGEMADPTMAYPVSETVIDFLKNTGSLPAINAAVNRFNAPTVAALEGTGN